MFPVATRCDSLPVGPTVVTQEQYAAALEADQILANARAEAGTIRHEAKEEYERKKKQGYADGMDQSSAESAERMIGAVAEAVAYFDSVELRVVEVVSKCLHKILGELDEQELIVSVIRNALRWARNQSRVTLRVAPSHAEGLRQRVDDILKNYPAIDVLDISADERMAPGDCVLETEIGSVNASLDRQLAAIETALRKSIAGAAGDESTAQGAEQQAEHSASKTSLGQP